MHDTPVIVFRPKSYLAKEFKSIAGELSPEKLAELLTLLQTTEIKPGACIWRIEWELTQTKDPGIKQFPDNHHQMIVKFFDDIKHNCFSDEELEQLGDKPFERSMKCFTNFLRGKCKCEFMRATFGHILRPKLYR